MSNTEYLLSRNIEESARSYGYLIHPSIAATLPHAAQIIEIATGTGIWALETAQEYPDSHVNAFDISDAQFPPSAAYTGKNVQFHVHDMRIPFPNEHHGKYDLVHVRAVVAGMSVDDWKLSAVNLLQLLKPDGALQWGEGDLAQAQILRGSSTVAAYPRTMDIIAAWNKELGIRDLTGPRRLPQVLAEAGFRVDTIDVVASDRLLEMREAWTRNYLIVVLDWAARQNDLEIVRKDFAGAVKAEVDAGWTATPSSPENWDARIRHEHGSPVGNEEGYVMVDLNS
nr:n-methyltransferase sirn [Quercus suber]